MLQIPVRGITSLALESLPLSYDLRMLIYLLILIALGYHAALVRRLCPGSAADALCAQCSQFILD